MVVLVSLEIDLLSIQNYRTRRDAVQRDDELSRIRQRTDVSKIVV